MSVAWQATPCGRTAKPKSQHGGNMLCACGCGERTKISDRTDAARGVVKGQPLNYINGHATRGSLKPPRYEVSESGCWNWTGPMAPTGYGLWGRQGVAHRTMWEQANGPIPDGLQLDHLCRNRRCVNPAHLEPVTNAENSRRGDGTKLTWQDVRAIRESDGTNVAIGERFGVHPAHISRIRNHRLWVAA